MTHSQNDLSKQLLEQLRRFGIATESVAELQISVEDWCETAQASATTLHRPVRIIQHSFLGATFVSALVDDWPAAAA